MYPLGSLPLSAKRPGMAPAGGYCHSMFVYGCDLFPGAYSHQKSLSGTKGRNGAAGARKKAKQINAGKLLRLKRYYLIILKNNFEK